MVGVKSSLSLVCRRGSAGSLVLPIDVPLK
jgi:hypothetical protein